VTPAPKTSFDARELAREYIRAGFAVVPVPARTKKPVIEKWQHLRITEADVSRYFQKTSNIGLLLGLDGKADIDLDCPESIRIGAALLPGTPATFGRPGKPRSHRLYVIDPALPTTKFLDPLDSKVTLVEFRCLSKKEPPIGLQTVLPGSVHPTGELISWEAGLQQPAGVDGQELLRTVHRIAAASALAIHWPEHGNRHNAMLALAGLLARNGWSETAAVSFCRAVADAARTGSPERTAQVNADVADTCGRQHAGKPVTGYSVLAKMMPEAVILKVAEWLELRINETRGGAQTAQEWPDLIPFGHAAVDQIPADCLPGWLGAMAVAVSKSTETPFEMAALLSLAIASSTVSGKARVSPEPGYFEPLNLYVCPAMESGNRKTAVLNALQRPLVEWERNTELRDAPERMQRLSDRRTVELQIEKLRKKAAASEQPRAFFPKIHELEQALPEPKPVRRLFVDDCTPEALAQRMQENSERMGVFSDEGGIFEILAGRYSNGVPNLDLFLKAHAGSPVRVDRANKDRPPILLNEPSLAVGISPQPNVLESFRDKPGFRGRGLLARFLYALPGSLLGYRSLVPQELPEATARAYVSGIHRLIDFAPDRPLVLTFARDAYKEWKDFQHALEPQFQSGGALEGLKDWGSKLAGAAARIAGVCHMVDQACLGETDTEIPRPTIIRALDLAVPLISHARAAFALMESDPTVEFAQRIAVWLVRNERPSFTVRDCFRAHQHLFKRVDAMAPVLALLAEHGYIRRVGRDSSGGRPPSDLIEVNPAVLAWEKQP
jgi:hypothetical protein